MDNRERWKRKVPNTAGTVILILRKYGKTESRFAMETTYVTIINAAVANFADLQFLKITTLCPRNKVPVRKMFLSYLL